MLDTMQSEWPFHGWLRPSDDFVFDLHLDIQFVLGCRGSQIPHTYL